MSEATPSATGGKLTNKPAFDIIHTKRAAPFKAEISLPWGKAAKRTETRLSLQCG